MTPDMRRLCQAAEEAFETVFHGDAEITPGGSETIVRAVLLALREPSYGMLRAAEDAEKVGEDGRMVRGDFDREICAMLDHILAQPSTA
jgi:hypothetical protein